MYFFSYGGWIFCAYTKIWINFILHSNHSVPPFPPSVLLVSLPQYIPHPLLPKEEVIGPPLCIKVEHDTPPLGSNKLAHAPGTDPPPVARSSSDRLSPTFGEPSLVPCWLHSSQNSRSLESISSYELGSAFSVDFPFMILTSSWAFYLKFLWEKQSNF